MSSRVDVHYRFVVTNHEATADELLREFISMPHDFTVEMQVSSNGRRDENRQALMTFALPLSAQRIISQTPTIFSSIG